MPDFTSFFNRGMDNNETMPVSNNNNEDVLDEETQNVKNGKETPAVSKRERRSRDVVNGHGGKGEKGGNEANGGNGGNDENCNHGKEGKEEANEGIQTQSTFNLD